MLHLRGAFFLVPPPSDFDRLQLRAAQDAAWNLIGIVVLFGAAVGGPLARAQVPADFSELPTRLAAPRVAKPSGDVLRRLERIEGLAKQQAWEELCDVADGLLAESADVWAPAGDGRFIGVREAVHRRLAALPAEGLAAYRGRVGAVANDWLAQGLQSRDQPLLLRVVDQAFCSSAGDDALWALGEIALERGEYQSARAAWQRLRPEVAPAGALVYPDASFDLAAVRARLALASLRELDLPRAEREIGEFRQQHPDATGRLGGREVNLADQLAEVLEQARGWPKRDKVRGDWLTLNGNPQRTNVSEVSVPADAKFERAWSLPTSPLADANAVGAAVTPTIVTNELVLFADSRGIQAVRLETGQPLGPSNRPLHAASEGEWTTCSLAADRRNVFAVASRASARGALRSQLVGVDLEREAALLMRTEPESDAAVFAGPPLVCGSRVIVGELSRGVGVKYAAACYDSWSGELVWRRTLGSASSMASQLPAVGMTLAESDGVAYVNTHLGMIAALRVQDGEPMWLRTYPRATRSAGDSQFTQRTRQPNPCMVHRSTVVASPEDSDQLLALDASTGTVKWSKPLPVPDARLLAVDNDRVLLTGSRLWAINLDDGNIDPSWGGELIGGAGQGAVAGKLIFWPTSAEILLVDRARGTVTSTPLALPEIGGAHVVVATADPHGVPYVIATGPGHVTAFRARQAR